MSEFSARVNFNNVRTAFPRMQHDKATVSSSIQSGHKMAS